MTESFNQLQHFLERRIDAFACHYSPETVLESNELHSRARANQVMASSQASSSAQTEFLLPTPPSDVVASLSFNPDPSHANQLLAASWDKTVRLYNLPADFPTNSDEGALAQAANECTLAQTFQHEAPVLDVCWISNTMAASGGIDRRVRLLNLETGQSSILGKHGSAISRIRYSASTGLLVSASWDATLKVWDPHASSPEGNGATTGRLLKTLKLPDKVLAMDISPPFAHTETARGNVTINDTTPRLVVAMAGRLVYIYDMSQWRAELDSSPTQSSSASPSTEEESPAWKPAQKRESSLKYMLRDIRTTTTGQGYATSSVEGRIAVEFFDASDEVQAQKYAFKCHRQVIEGIDTVYPVNGLAFHPIHGTFASIGADAAVSIWDPLAKKRIKQYAKTPSALSCGAISSDGAFLAVASGFENIEDANSTSGEVGGLAKGGPGHVQIHIRPAYDDCKPKPKAS